MMARGLLWWVLPACLLVAHASALAQASAEPLDGVLVRALAGPALLYTTQDVGAGADASATGAGFGIELALGAAVTDELVLGMDLWLGRSDAASHDLLGETALTAIFAGLGAGYFVIAERVLVNGALGLVRSSIEGAPVRLEIEIPQTDSSQIGFGAMLGAGVQWPLGSAFAIGAALSLCAGTAGNSDAGADTQRQVLSATLGVSLALR